MIYFIIENMCYIWTVEDVSKHFKGDSCSLLAISHSACYVIEAEHKIVTDFNSVNFLL